MFEKPFLAFGPFVVDPHTGEVRNGAALRKLTPKAFAVLQYLVAMPASW
jgi:DNA-binding winged helix-turn-helix (wHTH) protein